MRIIPPFLVVAAFVCDGQNVEASVTGTINPTANSTPYKWSNTFEEINDATCDGNSSYSESNAVEEACWSVPLTAISTGQRMIQLQINSCAKNSFSGTSQLKVGYSFDGTTPTYSNQIAIGGSYTSQTTNMNVSRLKQAGTTLKICARDDTGNGIRLSRLVLAGIKYLQIPGGLAITQTHNNAAKTELLTTASWSNVTDNDEFLLQYSRDGSTWMQAAMVTGDDVSEQHVWTPSMPGVHGETPQYRVSACYLDECTVPSAVASGLPSPTNFAGTLVDPSEDFTELTWNYGGSPTTFTIQDSYDNSTWTAFSTVFAPTSVKEIEEVPNIYRIWSVASGKVSIAAVAPYLPLMWCEGTTVPDGCLVNDSSCNPANVISDVTCSAETSIVGLSTYSFQVSADGGSNWTNLSGTEVTGDVRQPTNNNTIRYRGAQQLGGFTGPYDTYQNLARPVFTCQENTPGPTQRTCSWNSIAGAAVYRVIRVNGGNYVGSGNITHPNLSIILGEAGSVGVLHVVAVDASGTIMSRPSNTYTTP